MISRDLSVLFTPCDHMEIKELFQRLASHAEASLLPGQECTVHFRPAQPKRACRQLAACQLGTTRLLRLELGIPVCQLDPCSKDPLCKADREAGRKEPLTCFIPPMGAHSQGWIPPVWVGMALRQKGPLSPGMVTMPAL